MRIQHLPLLVLQVQLVEHCWLSRRLIRRWGFRMAYALESVLEQNGAEIRCLLRYYLERRFLQSQKCTIAESFYGTVRVRAAAQPDDKGQTKLMPLRTLDQTRLALFLALGPYLKERLRGWHNRWSEQEEQRQTKPRVLSCRSIAASHGFRSAAVAAAPEKTAKVLCSILSHHSRVSPSFQRLLPMEVLGRLFALCGSAKHALGSSDSTQDAARLCSCGCGCWQQDCIEQQWCSSHFC